MMKLSTTGWGILFLAVGVSGCGPGDIRESGPAADQPPGQRATDTLRTVAPNTVLTCEMLPDSLLEVRPTRAALRARYGNPESMAVGVEPNRHIPGATDSLFTLYYSRLRVTIRTPPGANDLPETVEIGDNRYLRFAGLVRVRTG